MAFGSTTLNCIRCLPTHYISGNRCVPRTKVIPNCNRTPPNSDGCDTCKPGFFFDSATQKCVVFPSGMNGCVRYHFQNYCKTCDTAYYKFNGACIRIRDKDLVENCVVHYRPRYCETCKAQFVAVAGTCRPVVALNCLTVATPFACATCAPDAGLAPVEDRIDCVPKTDTNCLTSLNFHPFACTQCAKGFYLTSTGCVAVPTPIVNCDFYSSATTCSACSPGFTLSKSKTSCMFTTNVWGYADPNCQNSLELPNP